MKLIDQSETIIVVVSADIDDDAPDRAAAERLKAEIDRRGAGHPYRRALVVSDLNWLDTAMFHETPTITIGGPGVNSVSGQFGTELPTVWTEDERVVIQADYADAMRRVALWGMDADGTTAAVEAFISRGWLDEFLDRCWRFRAGAFA